MSDAARESGSIMRLAVETSPKLVRALFPAIGCFAMAIVFSDDFIGLGFLVVGVSLVAIAGLIFALACRHRAIKTSVWDAATELYWHETTPCFGTDAEGAIRFSNPAAQSQFSQVSGYLDEVFSDLFASPKATLYRMRHLADQDGSAEEEFTHQRQNATLAVHRVAGTGYIWRFTVSHVKADTETGIDPEIPVMWVNEAQAIVDMNEAMRSFLGGRPRSLDRVFKNLPVQSGRRNTIDTAGGQKVMCVAALGDGSGLRKILFLPRDLAEDDQKHSDSLPVPILRISPTGEILLSNKRAQKLLQIDTDQPRDFAEVVEGLGRPIEEWLLDVVEGRSAGRTEVVRASRPSQDVYLQVALGRMVENGEVSILAVLIDATELKTLEAQFVQSQKMQAIGQLAGGVAHDFNNLLTAISGHCDLLLLRHEPGDPNYGDLVQINQNANRAASLVGQLLAFSRKQNMQPESIDLRDILGDLTHLLNRLVGEKIELTSSHDPDLPQIRADKRQLEQVLMNLVVNARDAMPGGGKIEILTETEELTEPLLKDRAEVPKGAYVVVRVKDQGCGIDPDKLQKVFEPFYSTKKTGEGTGLGLSMAYGIVKQSSGYIFADSIVGQGSVFTMFFPAYHRLVSAESIEIPMEKRAPHKQKGGIVLLVEDEAPVRAFASRALRLRGYTVLEAASAEEALETLQNEELKVDVFVTDVIMPGMDGPTWVTKALKQRPEVKVVFVSGYAEDSINHNRAKIPNSVFLPKPFSLSQLTETVQTQIN